MTSILKVDTIQDADGNNIINESGNTITVGASGDTTNVIGTLNKDGVAVENTPSFYAYLSANQSISSATTTKIQINTEIFDTDNTYDNSTNYRFTVPSGKGGKYLISYGIGAGADSHTNLYRIFTQLYKNGSNSNLLASVADPRNNYGFAFSVVASGVVDLSAGDYIEVYAYNSSGNTAGLNLDRTYFSGFRIGA